MKSLNERNYRLQDGCANCQHVFVRTEYEGDDELYCSFGAPQRPACMSVLMEEHNPVPGAPWGFDEEGQKKWDEWKDGRRVLPQGLCTEWMAGGKN